MNEEKIEFKDSFHFSIKIQSIKRYPMHWHANITEILLPIKNSIEVVAGHECILVKEGDFWFVNNGIIHSINASPEAIVATIHIDLNYFQNQFGHIKYMFFRNNMFAKTQERIESDNLDEGIRKEYKIQFKNLLVCLLSGIGNDSQLSDSFLHNLQFQLVYSMVYEFHWLKFLKRKDVYISPFQLDRYHRVVRFMKKNYKNKITLGDVASMEFITNNYFSHFWKDLCYFSLQERLNYERVIRAEMLLLATNESIISISDGCGFSDVKYFYNQFKRWYGHTPLEHRKKCLQFNARGAIYQNIDPSNINELIDSYVSTYHIPFDINDQISILASFANNYRKIKTLYQMNKKMLTSAPRTIVVDIFNHGNFRIKNNNVIFNWYIIDQLVHLCDSLPFIISIKLNPDYMDKPWFNQIIGKFLDFCIFRYGISTIKKWEFYADYRGDVLYNPSNVLRETVGERIKDIKVGYYFEI